MNRRRALGAFTALAMLPLLAACPGDSEPNGGERDSGKSDCDLGDLVEGDKDCDLRTKKPATDADKKPKPRKTKRP